MPPRIIVAIECAPAARAQAVCRTEECTAGSDGQRWTGEPHIRRADAEAVQLGHREWHRQQQARASKKPEVLL
jgi:hypothetical protein